MEKRLSLFFTAVVAVGFATSCKTTAPIGDDSELLGSNQSSKVKFKVYRAKALATPVDRNKIETVAVFPKGIQPELTRYLNFIDDAQLSEIPAGMPKIGDQDPNFFQKIREAMSHNIEVESTDPNDEFSKIIKDFDELIEKAARYETLLDRYFFSLDYDLHKEEFAKLREEVLVNIDRSNPYIQREFLPLLEKSSFSEKELLNHDRGLRSTLYYINLSVDDLLENLNRAYYASMTGTVYRVTRNLSKKNLKYQTPAPEVVYLDRVEMLLKGIENAMMKDMRGQGRTSRVAPPSGLAGELQMMSAFRDDAQDHYDKYTQSIAYFRCLDTLWLRTIARLATYYGPVAKSCLLRHPFFQLQSRF